jgi:hypothetical protein
MPAEARKAIAAGHQPVESAECRGTVQSPAPRGSVPYTDPEKRREFQRKWRAANREKLRQASQKWRNANLDKARHSTRAYREANREKVRALQRKYDAAKRARAKERVDPEATG